MKLILRLVVAFIAISSSVAFAAKPAPPPPPVGCAGVPGTFPSIVFGKLVETGSGVVSSWDIYVGNSEGTCAVKVYSIAGVTANNISMAANGAQYRIVWEQSQRVSKNGPYYGSVKMVQFTVDDANKSINQPLPLQASTLYTDQSDTTVATIFDASISSDGSVVVFTRQQATAISLNLLDISGCTASCPLSIAFPDGGYDGLSGAVFGAGRTNRVYFTAKKITQAWGLYFLEKNNAGTWIGPRLVASMADHFYSDAVPNNNAARPSFPEGRKIYWPRATVLNGAELVSFSAYTRELLPDGSSGASIKGVDIIDVTNCSSSGSGSCLDNTDIDEANVVAYNIPGEEHSGGWERDPSTGEVFILTQTFTPGVLLRDMKALYPFAPFALKVDHGLGMVPDGIK